MKELGVLEKIEPREYWASEASDFTPWLAEEKNLALLSKAIGLDLELEATEKNVGPFRADILCKETTTDHWVLVENQLEKTNHTHLGQLLTYAAGLKAVTIVWIAKPIREEHRAALDWLNNITDDTFNFFGIEIELWKIGDSAAAPKFNVVSKPNDWSKQVSSAKSTLDTSELTESKELQFNFWQGFREYCENKTVSFNPQKPRPQHWMNISVGRSGFHLAAIASLWNGEKNTYDINELRAELVLVDKHKSSTQYMQLLADKDEIENEFGEALNWIEKEGVTMKKVLITRDADLKNEDLWDEYFEWLSVKIESLNKVFRERIKNLD